MAGWCQAAAVSRVAAWAWQPLRFRNNMPGLSSIIRPAGITRLIMLRNKNWIWSIFHAPFRTDAGLLQGGIGVSFQEPCLAVHGRPAFARAQRPPAGFSVLLVPAPR